METLVVAHHKHQYYGHAHVQFGSFGSVGGFKDINCRTFESGAGILPTPLRSFTKPVDFHTDDQKKSKKLSPSSAISIPISIRNGGGCRKEETLNDEFAYCELWAGPTYSNSPPPSSLPMPKFSLKPKRTVSLDLPSSPSDLDLPTFAKSAPASPTSSCSPFTGVLFDSTDSATLTLRRILNLEVSD